jgi:hypothetical protein
LWRKQRIKAEIGKSPEERTQHGFNGCKIGRQANGNNATRGAASRAQVLSNGFGSLEERCVADVGIAIDDSNGVAPAQSYLSKTFAQCGLGVQRIERTEPGARIKAVAVGMR